MFRILVFFLAIMNVSVLIGCSGGLSTSQKNEVNEALQALGKISAATEIGVNYRQYDPLVLEANAQVNDVIEIVPGGQLRDELVSAMTSYVDARAAWRYQLASQYHEYLEEDEDPGNRLFPKYSLPKNVTSHEAVQIIWQYAGKHFINAKELYKSATRNRMDDFLSFK